MKIFGFPLWVYFLFIATLALGTDEFVISGILPEVAREFGVTNGVAGFLVTAFAVAFCFGSPLIAFLTDKFEKRKILTLGLWSLQRRMLAWQWHRLSNWLLRCV